MTQRTDHDERDAFVLSLPRRVTELRATLGTIVADTRSQRMRDELRRRLHALYTHTRSHELQHLSEGLRETIAHVDALRSSSVLSQRDLEALGEHVQSLTALAQRDVPERPDLFERPRDRGMSSRVSAPSLSGSLAPRSLNIPPAAPTGFSPVITEGSRSTPSLRPPPSGLAIPIGVLVAASAATAEMVRRAAPRDAEITVVHSLADAVRAARDVAPDVVIAETIAPTDGLGLLVSLRGDPLTDFIPVLLLTSAPERIDDNSALQQGAFDVLSMPVHPERLGRAIGRAIDATIGTPSATTSFGELTLEELTRTLQEELRRGLMGAVSPGTNATKVQMGEGSEVLAATWEAIARVRDVVSKRSQGRVRFERPASPMGIESTHILSVGDDEESSVESEGDDPLVGRRVLVVDDEPNVVWFFANLLREAGMDVIECNDGVSALTDARKARPDVVIADILMPGLDGFSLCRAIRRDVSLRYVPVVLLSWREDLITRMRELGAQAQGYLRKESKGEAILARVRSVLRPRARLLQRIESIAESEEIRGRVERLGAVTLIEVIARSVRSATLAISDSLSVTEIELRGGRLVSVVRTAQDGSLSRGEPALVQVLGASTARFVIKRATHTVRSNLHGEIEDILESGAILISALEDSVSGASLVEIASLELDDDSARAYAQSLPTPMRALIERMIAGDSPRDLILREGVSPQDLDPLLVELARRAVIRAVRGGNGEDLVALRREMIAREWRGETLPTGPAMRASVSMPAVLFSPHLSEPASPASEPGPARSDTSAPVSEKALPVSEPAPAVSEPRPSSPEWKRPSSMDELGKPGFGLDEQPDPLVQALLAELGDSAKSTKKTNEFAKIPATRPSDEPVSEPVSEPAREPVVEPGSEPEKRSRVPFSSEPDKGETAAVGVTVGDADEAHPRARRDVSGERPKATVLGIVVDSDEPSFEESEGEAELSDAEIELAAKASPGIPLDQVELDARGLPRKRTRTQETDRSDSSHVPVSVATSNSSIIVDEAAVGARVEVTEPKRRRTESGLRPALASPTAWLWLLIGVILLGFGSYALVRALLPPTPVVPVVAPATTQESSATVPAAETPSPGSVAAEPAQPDSAIEDAPSGPDELFAAPQASATPSAGIEDNLDPALFWDGGTPRAGQGLLVVDGEGTILVGTRELGAAPLRVELAPGQHNLTYARNNIRGFRVIEVREGRAVRLVLPAQP
ncbi:MAG: response regulator [Deltaproteobacteria bacterium]|nr:response regulator [Deltaproteobacteria bacterium]